MPGKSLISCLCTLAKYGDRIHAKVDEEAVAVQSAALTAQDFGEDCATDEETEEEGEEGEVQDADDPGVGGGGNPGDVSEDEQE